MTGFQRIIALALTCECAFGNSVGFCPIDWEHGEDVWYVLTKDLSGLPEGICMLGEHARVPWRMQGCFHYSPYKQMETMDNLLRKHLPCMAACIIFQHIDAQSFWCRPPYRREQSYS